MTISLSEPEPVSINFEFESLPPLDGMDRIYAEYSKTFGRLPDEFMAKVVGQTKADLFIWWGAHRERIRDALVAAEEAERLNPPVAPEPPTNWEDLADYYVKLSGKRTHASDCATSCAPAMKPGPCDCDAVDR